jgi:hypothetical protein
VFIGWLVNFLINLPLRSCRISSNSLLAPDHDVSGSIKVKLFFYDKLTPGMFPPNILVSSVNSHQYYSTILNWYGMLTSGRHTNWTHSHPTPRINNNKKISIPQNVGKFLMT